MSQQSSSAVSRRLEPTPENPSSALRWSHLVGLILTVALGLLGINQYASHYLSENTPNWAFYMTTKKWRQLDTAQGQLNWLVFGDSAAAHGFDPEEFDVAIPNARSHNFGIVATLGLANDAWMLSEYIRLHGAPKNVILIHTFDAWTRTYNAELLAKIPRAFGFWKTFSPSIELSTAQTWSAFKTRYFPLFAEAKSLKQILDSSAWNHRWFTAYANGFSPARLYRAKTFKSDLRGAKRTLRSKGTKKVNPLNQRALKHIQKLAQTHGIRVYIVKAPIWDKLIKDKHYRRHQRAIWAHLKKLVKASKNIRLIEKEFPFKATEMEAAVDHVSPPAAWAYSRQLATTLLNDAKKNEVKNDSNRDTNQP